MISFILASASCPDVRPEGIHNWHGYTFRRYRSFCLRWPWLPPELWPALQLHTPVSWLHVRGGEHCHDAAGGKVCTYTAHCSKYQSSGTEVSLYLCKITFAMLRNVNSAVPSLGHRTTYFCWLIHQNACNAPRARLPNRFFQRLTYFLSN